ncbi:hypothetical protein QR680_018239 [Steinernema hermaphroditum]|uniref:Uncharacterized protein n=1 Tax=Steinernema hermaphroditum TaxID=289476 RepID=A0AA39HI30_9BILA|nr:hypothetical protein QR680_018239 [Steinernema hermaphroditum]
MEAKQLFVLSVLPNASDTCLIHFSMIETSPASLKGVSFEEFKKFPEKESYRFEKLLITDTTAGTLLAKEPLTSLKNSVFFKEVLPFLYTTWKPESLEVKSKNATFVFAIFQASKDVSFAGVNFLEYPITAMNRKAVDSFLSAQVEKKRLTAVWLPSTYSTPARNEALKKLLLQEQFDYLDARATLKVDKETFTTLYNQWKQKPVKRAFRGLELCVRPADYGRFGMHWLPPERDLMAIHHPGEPTMFCVEIGSFPENEIPIMRMLNGASGTIYYKAHILMNHQDDDEGDFYVQAKRQWHFVVANPLAENLPPQLIAEYNTGEIDIIQLLRQFGRNFAAGE